MITLARGKTFRPALLRSARVALAYSPALIFGLFATGAGMPTLRHDWLTLSSRMDLLQFTLITLSWHASGIGAVRAYPTDYLFAISNTLVALVFGTRLSLFALVTAVGALCVYGARSLARTESNGPWASFGLSLFALFNPWVYVKLVEGHVAMIAAYGALMALVAELFATPTNWRRAALLLAPMAQLQFFIIGVSACAIAFAIARRRAALVPIACATIYALPSVVGLAVDHGNVASTPYNLDWQTSQSIAPIDAAALAGFFTHYLKDFPPVAFDAIWAIAAIAAIGLFSSLRARSIVVLVVAAVGWALATGTKGPFASTYVGLVQHFPPIEIYRELYDLVALVAIAYVAIAAIATARFRALAYISIVPGLVLIAMWFHAPPNEWWLERADVPRLAVDAPPNTRFALYPDATPMSFHGRGSGNDPDAYARANNVTPLDDAESQYPATAALRRFARDGDTTVLSALGVSRLYDRPSLQSDAGSISAQSALRSSSIERASMSPARSLSAAPELSLLDRVSVTTALPGLGSGKIFFDDVAGQRGALVPVAWRTFDKLTVATPGRRLDAREDWVDVREAFAAEPELGEPFGGALTTSSSAQLNIPGDGSLLAYVRAGRLRSPDGKSLSGTTPGYRWIGVPAGVSKVSCDGECVVIGRSVVPKIVGSAAPGSTALAFHAPFPWLAWSAVPPRSHETVVKYLVGYDRAMILIGPSGLLPHVRVEDVFNGWLVAPHAGNAPIYIVDVVSAVQFVTEFAAFGFVLALARSLVRNRNVLRTDGRS